MAPKLDIGWEHGIAVGGSKKKITCNYCNKVVSGGVTRLKEHLAGLQVMKRKQTGIADLHYDVLKQVMLFVAKSYDGAPSFARIMSICKGFKELSTDPDILRKVAFCSVFPYEINESFWQMNGLLVQCAHAGNLFACEILSKRVEDFVKSAKGHLIACRIAELDVASSLNIVTRQVCTRARRRQMQLSVEVMEMQLQAIDVDLEKAEELLDVMRKSLQMFKSIRR